MRQTNSVKDRLKAKVHKKEYSNIISANSSTQDVVLFDKVHFREIDNVERIVFEVNYFAKEKNYGSFFSKEEIFFKIKKPKNFAHKPPSEKEFVEYINAKVRGNHADPLLQEVVDSLLKSFNFSSNKYSNLLFSDIFKSYETFFDKKNLIEFKKIYNGINDLLTLTLTNKEYPYYKVFSSFIDLGSIFLRQFIESMGIKQEGHRSRNSQTWRDKKFSKAEFEKGFDLLSHGYKYYYYAVERLVNNKGTLLSTKEANSKGLFEVKDDILGIIYGLSEWALQDIITFARNVIDRKDLLDINLKKKYSNLLLQCLESKVLMEMFIIQEGIEGGDKELVIQALIKSLIKINEFKEVVPSALMEDEKNINITSDIYKKQVEITTVAAERKAEELKNEEYKELKKRKKNKKEKQDHKQFEQIEENTKNYDSEEETKIIIRPKKELSAGKKFLQQGREQLKSKAFEEAIAYFEKAKDYFLNKQDFENGLEALTGIADSSYCHAEEQLKDSTIKKYTHKAPELLKNAQKYFLNASEAYRKITKLTLVNNLKETYSSHVEACKEGLEIIERLIESNTRYLKEYEERYREICKNKKITLALKTLIQQEIHIEISKLSLTDPVKYNNNVLLNNTLSYYMRNTPQKYWDISYLLENFNNFTLEGFDFSYQAILAKGKQLWKNNPKYKGMDKEAYLKALRTHRIFVDKEMLKQYEELQKENQIAKIKVDLIKYEIEKLKGSVSLAQPSYMITDYLKHTPYSSWSNKEKHVETKISMDSVYGEGKDLASFNYVILEEIKAAGDVHH
ncbi:MAG: hypothetical protein K0Q51_216 [Rickettsiaceae bacterium]|jgi:hypothetical protein|nr:hypothetical protein [Rickettsiaceae bacterium]